MEFTAVLKVSKFAKIFHLVGNDSKKDREKEISPSIHIRVACVHV